MANQNKFAKLPVENDIMNSTNKIVEAGEKEHPLQFKYAIWFSKKVHKQASYEENLHKIAAFSSVEQFWHIYSHLILPNDLEGHYDYHIFKDGVQPMWEDEANRRGGKWIIRLKKGLASRCWESIVLAMLGEQFMVGDEVCGIVISVRPQEDILSVWNKTATDEATTTRIRDTLRRVLNLPANTVIEYKEHTDSLKDHSSYWNTYIYK